MEGSLVATWRAIIQGDGKSWVLFGNGTCVIVMDPQADLAVQAVDILREWGPVHAGSSAGDFSVVHLQDDPGWVVMCHHPDVLTYVGPDDLRPDEGGQGPPDVAIGVLGRFKRSQDAEELNVLHVEDRRAATGS